MLFKILNILGRRIPIGDHIGNTVQAAQMGKCPFVEFGFIKQHVNIFHILKEIIIQWKLCPVGDGVTVFQVSTVNREKQLVKIQLPKILYDGFVQGFNMVASKMDIASKEKNTDIMIGSKLQRTGNVSGNNCDPLLVTFVQVTAEKRTCKTGSYKKDIAGMDKVNGLLGNSILALKLVICHFDGGENLEIIGFVLFGGSRPLRLLCAAMCTRKKTLLLKLCKVPSVVAREAPVRSQSVCVDAVWFWSR